MDKLRLFKFYNKIDLRLLAFIICISYYSYSIKFATIFLFFIWTWISNKNNFRIKRNIIREDAVSYFYLVLILIAMINLLINYSKVYLVITIVAIFIWLLNLINYKSIKLMLVNISYEKTINTLSAFVLINFIFSIFNLTEVWYNTGTFSPYNQIVPPPYGAMSGDHIKGLFMSNHLPNAVISGFLSIYFLSIKRFKIAFCSLVTLMLTSSNLMTIVILPFLLVLFIVGEKRLKYYVILSFSFIVIFYVKYNPINYYSISKTLRLTKENKYMKDKLVQAFSENDKQLKLDSLKKDWGIIHYNNPSENKSIENHAFENNNKQFKLVGTKEHRNKISSKDPSDNKAIGVHAFEKNKQLKLDTLREHRNKVNYKDSSEIKAIEVPAVEKHEQPELDSLKKNQNMFYSKKPSDKISVDSELFVKNNKQSKSENQEVNRYISHYKERSEDTFVEPYAVKKQKNESKKLLNEFEVIWNRRDSLKRRFSSKDSLLGDGVSFDVDREYGLLRSLKQTYKLINRDIKTMLLGNGAGNFSSSLAFIAARKEDKGNSRLLTLMIPKYKNIDFENNHEAIYDYLLVKGVEYHSIIHFPYNTYNTLIGEYGVLGFLAFVLLFIGMRLIKAFKTRLMSVLIIIPLFMILVGTYYWFETFTFIAFFEIVVNNELRKKNIKNDKLS